MAFVEDAMSDMICEHHPDYLWPHDDCPGPGMPHPEIARLRAQLAKLEQEANDLAFQRDVNASLMKKRGEELTEARREVERLKRWVPDNIEGVADNIASAFLDDWGLRWGEDSEGDRRKLQTPRGGSALAQVDLAMRIGGAIKVLEARCARLVEALSAHHYGDAAVVCGVCQAALAEGQK